MFLTKKLIKTKKNKGDANLVTHKGSWSQISGHTLTNLILKCHASMKWAGQGKVQGAQDK